jgi:transposase
MDDSRLLLTDATWGRMAAVITDVKSRAGAPPEIADRDFVEGILYLARTGCPWRDLPGRFGDWNAAYKRFRRWLTIGVWQALFERLPADLAAVRTVFFDSTVIRAHQHAAGARRSHGGAEAQALGRSRGGLGTKIHAAAADERTAVAAALTAGQCGDAPQFIPVCEAIPEECPVDAAVADMAFDSDAIREYLVDRDIAPVIPSSANRAEPIEYDAAMYRERNKVERLFNRLKQFRRIATRYEKLALTFLAMIHLVASVVMTR